MKVVTAAAALDSGRVHPEHGAQWALPQVIGGVPSSNAGGEQFGDIDMTTALTHSVNTYFAQVGEKLGNDTMFKYMDRFGFNQDPELGYPDSEMAPSGVYNTDTGNLLGPSDAIDIGRVAIGQERLLVTPLQMAEVAATVANGGVLGKADVRAAGDRPRWANGREARPARPVDRDQHADRARADPDDDQGHRGGNGGGPDRRGQSFAGKTGTAEIDPAAGINRPWFIGFAPADNPQVAVAVMLERCQGCFGGEVAGPIATQVMESLINR
jgi:peptidoglycan glycosyltransferase